MATPQTSKQPHNPSLHNTPLIYQALRLVKTDLEATRQAKAALAAEAETKDATIATLHSKVVGGGGEVMEGWDGK